MKRTSAKINAERRGFALVELIAVCALLFVAALMLFAAAGKQRRNSQQTESISNLRQIGAMMGAYTGDSAGGLPSFTWRANTRYGQFFPTSELEAGAMQATDVLRRRFDLSFALPLNWIAQPLYAHLVLADHAGLKLPSTMFVSPGDPVLTQLSRDPATLSQFPTLASQPRTVVRSSYFTSTSVYYRGETASGGALQFGGNQVTYLINPGSSPALNFVPRAASDAANPSQKVYMADTYDWFSRSVPLHFGLGDARCGTLMFDGSAGTRAFASANAGAYFREGTNPNYRAATFSYVSDAVLNPAVPTGAPTVGTGRGFFTFRQIAGRDFGPQAP